MYSVVGGSRTLADKFGCAFVERYKDAEEASARYAKFHDTWSACYATHEAAMCQDAPKEFQAALADATDGVVAQGGLGDVTLLLEVNEKLRPQLRYKQKELQARLDAFKAGRGTHTRRPS